MPLARIRYRFETAEHSWPETITYRTECLRRSQQRADGLHLPWWEFDQNQGLSGDLNLLISETGQLFRLLDLSGFELPFGGVIEAF